MGRAAFTPWRATWTCSGDPETGEAPCGAGILFAANSAAPWLAAGALASIAAGIVLGILAAPPAAGRRNLFLLALLHSPAAWASMALYVLMTLSACAGAMLNRPLLAMIAPSIAPSGATLAFIALWTGSFWGGSIWRAGRSVDMAPEATLALLYIAFILLRIAAEDGTWADRVAAVISAAGLAALLAVVGTWPHWPAVLRFLKTTGSDPQSMTYTILALAAVTTGLLMHGSAVALLRLRCVILEHERGSAWVRRHTGSRR